MAMWKSAALAAALAVSVGIGAALAPVAYGQGARAVPTDVQVISGLRGSQIGVSIHDVPPADVKAGQPPGVRVERVTEDSPADKAGLRAKDLIVEFDGERVRSVRQFTRLVQESVPGRPVPLVVQRDGQRASLTVEPAEAGGVRWLADEGFRVLDDLRGLRVTPPRPPSPPSPPVRPAPRAFPDMESFIWRTTNRLGITVSELSPQLAEYFGVSEGVLVTAVHDDSPAARAGLKAGDVVTSLNGAPVGTGAQLRREMQRLGSDETFTLDVVRDRKPLTLKGRTDEGRDTRRTFRTVV